MTEFSNKRRHRRFSMDVMDIRGSAVFAAEVVINDISVTGMSLIIDRKLEVGREYSLGILEDSQDQPIRGIVVWCRDNEEAGKQGEGSHSAGYAAGIRFIDLGQGTIIRLINFIESHLIEGHKHIKTAGMKDLRCKIRFPVNAREGTVLNVAETYRIKEVSLGGLLIEGSHYLEPDTRLHMGITMPGDMNLSFTGRVVSCTVSPDNAVRFDIGIEFLEMAEPDRIRLKGFIRRLYLEDAGFPVGEMLPEPGKQTE